MYTDQSTHEEPQHHRGDLVLVKLPDKPPTFGIVRDDYYAGPPTRTYLIATDEPYVLKVAAEHVHPARADRAHMADIGETNQRCVERALQGLALTSAGRRSPGVAE